LVFWSAAAGDASGADAESAPPQPAPTKTTDNASALKEEKVRGNGRKIEFMTGAPQQRK
jgi:hypothetical protein